MIEKFIKNDIEKELKNHAKLYDNVRKDIRFNNKEIIQNLDDIVKQVDSLEKIVINRMPLKLEGTGWKIIVKRIVLKIASLLNYHINAKYRYRDEIIISILRKMQECCKTLISKSVVADDEQEFIDYNDFENKFRGSEESIKSRCSRYVNYFNSNDIVIDLGCGRGELLELLCANGINAIGIDTNAKNIEYCQNKNIDVVKMDMFDYLSQIEDNVLDGIISIQVIEHITPKQLAKLVRLCYEKLKPSGKLILETQNPTSLYCMAVNFYIDPTHIRPVHPNWLSYLLDVNGFINLKFEYPDYSVPWDKVQLYPSEIKDNDDEKKRIDSLNSLLYGPIDYAVICEKNNK